VHATEAELAGEIGVGAIHTGNARLAGSALEESDNVLEITPALNYRRETRRFNADIDYSAQAYFYEENSDADTVYHQLELRTLTTLAADALFLDAIVTNDQSLVDPNRAFSIGNIGISGNLTDVRTATLAPYLVVRPGRAEGVLRYDHSKFDYDDATFADADYETVSFSLAGDEFTTATWGLDYARERIEYDAAVPIKFQHFQVEVGYWVNRTIRLFTAQGIEDDYRSPTDGSLELHYWDAGLGWQPSSRTSLTVAAGERNFGRSGRFEWSTLLRRGSVTLSYTEDPTTQARSHLTNLRQIGAGGTLIDQTLLLASALDQAGDSSLYVQKALRGEIGLNLKASSWTVGVYRETRSDFVELFEAPPVADPRDEELYGIDIGWTWDMQANAVMSVDISRADRTVRNDPDDDLFSFGVGFDFGLKPNLSLGVALSHLQREASGLSGDYEENQVHVKVTRRFTPPQRQQQAQR
jgi:uncharacterized protein (PEP-CTERM system associated)